MTSVVVRAEGVEKSFGTTAVLTRRMFVVPVLMGALVVALIVWLGLELLLASRQARLLVPWAGAL